jgi:hypothetical protein
MGDPWVGLLYGLEKANCVVEPCVGWIDRLVVSAPKTRCRSLEDEQTYLGRESHAGSVLLADGIVVGFDLAHPLDPPLC